MTLFLFFLQHFLSSFITDDIRVSMDGLLCIWSVTQGTIESPAPEGTKWKTLSDIDVPRPTFSPLCLHLPRGLIPSDFAANALASSPIRATLLANLILPDLINPTFDENTNYEATHEAVVHFAVNSFLLNPNIFDSTPFSDTVYILPVIWDTQFHTHKILQSR